MWAGSSLHSSSKRGGAEGFRVLAASMDRRDRENLVGNYFIVVLYEKIKEPTWSLKRKVRIGLGLVELLEYSLVVLVSSMVTVFSFAVYGGYSSMVGGSTDEAGFSEIVALANAAIEHGNSTSALILDHAVITCASNTLEYSSPRFSGSVTLPVSCSISRLEVSGQRLLTMRYADGELSLQVR